VLIKSILGDLQYDVDKLNEVESRDQIHSVTVTTALPVDSNYKISFDYSTNPSYDPSGVTYFYSGSVTNQPTSKFLSNDANDIKFDPTKGAFQIFIRYTILKPIIDDISATHKFFFNVRDLPKSINFLKLDIDHLGQIIPNIYNHRAKDEKIIITGNVNSINVDATTQTKGTCNVDFTIFNSDGDTTLLSWVNTFRYELRPYEVSIVDKDGKKSDGFNFQLKSVELLHTTISRSDFGTPETPALVNWVEKCVDAYVSNENTFALFKTGFDLGAFFKSYQTFEFDIENGFLIGGVPVDAPMIKKKEMTKEFYKRIKGSL